MALRRHPGDAGLWAPASRRAETWARGEGLILPGALRQGCICRLDICCSECSPIPIGGASALPNLSACPGAPPGPPLSPMSPGALASGGAPQYWGVLRPSAPPQDLRMVCQDRPPSCLEGFEGLPLLWEQHTVLPEPGVRADPALPQGSPGLLPWCLQPPSPPASPLRSPRPGATTGLPVCRRPHAAAWLQPGRAALPVPCVCLEFLPHQPSVALSSVNLILPDLHSRFFFLYLLVLNF